MPPNSLTSVSGLVVLLSVVAITLKTQNSVWGWPLRELARIHTMNTCWFCVYIHMVISFQLTLWQAVEAVRWHFGRCWLKQISWYCSHCTQSTWRYLTEQSSPWAYQLNLLLVHPYLCYIPWERCCSRFWSGIALAGVMLLSSICSYPLVKPSLCWSSSNKSHINSAQECFWLGSL